jgi:ketopantoate reductase
MTKFSNIRGVRSPTSDPKRNILTLGASYGSLLASKLILAGHDVTMICLPAEADAVNADGIRVKIPVRGRDGLVEVDSNKAPGNIRAAGPGDVDPKDYDLIGLAM